jgi:DNA-binding transcriptional LysR family regulator
MPARRRAQGGQSGRKGFNSFDRLVTNPQMRTLLAVAHAGNFSLAARNVGVSQPSLYRLARDLERLSGVDLSTKTLQGIELTQAAEILARHARLALAEIQQGLDELNAIRGVDSGGLRIGALPLVCTKFLPRAIDALVQRRPNVRVRVIDGPYDDLLNGLRHGEIDILVGALRDPAPIEDVVQTTLILDRLSIIARRGHPLVRRRRIGVEQLATYPWIAPRPGPPGRAQFDALFARAGVSVPPGLIETSSLILIRGLMLESDRLTLLSTHQVEPEIRQGMLEIIRFDLADAARPIGTTVRRDWQPTLTQALFLDLLSDACRYSNLG